MLLLLLPSLCFAGADVLLCCYMCAAMLLHRHAAMLRCCLLCILLSC